MAKTHTGPEYSYVRLERALLHIGLADMADRARTGYYSVYRSPLPDPRATLLAELNAEGEKGNSDAAALARQVTAGHFDPLPSEANDWVKNGDGRQILARLRLRQA